MTRKPNFAKFLLGIAVLALLFVGTWASTRAPLTSANRSAIKTAVSSNPNVASRYAALLAPAPGDDLISSVFELDGDIQDPAAGVPEDWNTVNCGGSTVAQDTEFVSDGLALSIFTQGGSKDGSDVSDWRHKDGSVPDKDELLNAYAAKYTGSPNGDDIIVFGTDRFSSNGDAFIGVWFFQQQIYAGPDGRFYVGDPLDPDPSDPIATHTDGDILVLLNFTGGGTTFGSSQVFEWVGGGKACVGTPVKGGTLCDISGTSTNLPVGISNSLDQDIPDSCAWNASYTPKTGTAGVIPPAQFFEGGINLDAFSDLADSCFSSFLVETRSSSSVTAQLKDFVLGQLDSCPEVTITKTADDDDICAGDDTTYTYTVTNPGAPLTGTVVDDNETPDDGDANNGDETLDDLDVGNNCAALNGGAATVVNLPSGNTPFQCTRTLSAGTHINIVTVTASAGGFSTSATATETVVVRQNPDVRISTITCFDGQVILTATDENGTSPVFSWTGPGGASSGATVAVTGTGSYTVTATSGDCTDTATRVVSFCSDTLDSPTPTSP